MGQTARPVSSQCPRPQHGLRCSPVVPCTKRSEAGLLSSFPFRESASRHSGVHRVEATPLPTWRKATPQAPSNGHLSRVPASAPDPSLTRESLLCLQRDESPGPVRSPAPAAAAPSVPVRRDLRAHTISIRGDLGGSRRSNFRRPARLEPNVSASSMWVKKCRPIQNTLIFRQNSARQLDILFFGKNRDQGRKNSCETRFLRNN